MNNRTDICAGESQPMTQTIQLREQLKNAEEHLQRLKRLDELAEAAKPLHDYLQKYHDPHTTITVAYGYVNIVEGIGGAPMEVKP